MIRFPFVCVLAALLLPISAAAAEPSATQRRTFLAAWHAARHDPPGRWQTLASGLESYPLYPYLEWAALSRNVARARPAEVRAFLAAYDGWPIADALRRDWLRRLAHAHDWRGLLSDWRAQDDLDLQCHHVTARIELHLREGLAEDASARWLNPRSLPPSCDPAIAFLRREGLLTDALVWRRIRLAAEARQIALVRHLYKYLSGAERAAAERLTRVLADPAVELAKGGGARDDAREREGVALALAQLARRDTDRAAALWPALEKRYAWQGEQGRALAAIALQKVVNYGADAPAWLARVPDAAADDALREWRVRETLARADWPATLAALAKLAPAQQADPRWRWVRARALELGGETGAAQAVLEALSGEANFHGFLAADRLDRPYAICPREPTGDAATRARIAAMPGLVRAFEWYTLDDSVQARREFDHALRALGDDDRRVAVALAHERRWYDRGPLVLLRPDDRPYYSLRFPLAHVATVRKRARDNGLEPGVILGLIRAESAWVADAHSHANARGLMQILPGNGPGLAKRAKVRYGGAGDLYRPALNIALGTRHLADELARWSGRLWVAAAAYNAGPAPVQRWLAARPGLPPDLWVETIPYKETREYVARVLAFATLYDWRLAGDAATISGRMGLGVAARHAVACATPTSDSERTASATKGGRG